MIQGVPSHSNFVHGCSTLHPGAELAGPDGRRHQLGQQLS